MSAATVPAWVDGELYPFQPRRFLTEDGELSYLDVGSGPTILFVHGTPSWSFEWRRLIAALAPRFRCIAPDHLGFGLSDKPERAPYTPADHARRLLALVRHLDLRDVTLVVHDFGGPIGLGALLEEPWRLRGLVVANSWMWPLGGDRRVRRISRLVRSSLGRFLYLRLNASPRWLLPASFADRRRLPRAVHRQYLAPFADRRSRTAPWALGVALAGADDFLAGLWRRRAVLAGVPVALVWGLADRAVTPAELAIWRAALPHAAVIGLDRVGHFPQEEAPTEILEQVERVAARSSVQPDGKKPLGAEDRPESRPLDGSAPRGR